jgi:hypothetical protein
VIVALSDKGNRKILQTINMVILTMFLMVVIGGKSEAEEFCALADYCI